MASGDTLCFFNAIDNYAPVSGNATFDIRNVRVCLDFDYVTEESAVFNGYMPSYYTGSGIKTSIYFAATSGTSGTVGWKICFERIGNQIQDIDSDGFNSITTSSLTTVSGDAGNIFVNSSDIPPGTGTDYISANELFRLKISRDVANDTLTDDAELYGIELREL